MCMKKVILILLFLVFTVKGFSDTFDFSAVCESGQTLYYRILNPQELIVVEPRLPNHTAPWSGYGKPTGDLVIPETVEYNGMVHIHIKNSTYGIQNHPSLQRRFKQLVFHRLTACR